MAKKDHSYHPKTSTHFDELEGLTSRLKLITKEGLKKHPNVGDTSINIGIGEQLSTKKWLVFNLLNFESNYFILGFFTSKQELKTICTNQFHGVITENAKELLFVGKSLMNDFIVTVASARVPDITFSKTSFMDSANFHFYFSNNAFKSDSWTIRDDQFSIDFILIHLPQKEGES